MRGEQRQHHQQLAAYAINIATFNIWTLNYDRREDFLRIINTSHRIPQQAETLTRGNAVARHCWCYKRARLFVKKRAQEFLYFRLCLHFEYFYFFYTTLYKANQQTQLIVNKWIMWRKNAKNRKMSFSISRRDQLGASKATETDAGDKCWLVVQLPLSARNYLFSFYHVTFCYYYGLNFRFCIPQSILFFIHQHWMLRKKMHSFSSCKIVKVHSTMQHIQRIGFPPLQPFSDVFNWYGNIWNDCIN